MAGLASVVRAGDGAHQSFGPSEDFTWKHRGASDGSIDFGELSVGSDAGVPEHIHHNHNEAYYILEGTYQFRLGDELAEAPAGAFVFIPRGTPHAWSNVSGQAGRMLIMFTPGGMTGYFEELAPLLPELVAGLPDMTSVAPKTMERATEIMRRYGYELVGPPSG